MAKIFITGSTDGIGLIAAQNLLFQGHEVVLHARNEDRARDLRQKLSTAHNILVGDLSSIDETKKLADRVNGLGKFDAIIHNAGVYQVAKKLIFLVNVLAPYILTSLVEKPKRLIYIGSNMHTQGNQKIENLSLESGVSYSDSKLYLLMLAFAVAREWHDVFTNTVDPGWVPTKMGETTAPDDLLLGAQTQTWLASDKGANFSGKYLHHMKEVGHSSKADDVSRQKQLLEICQEISGVKFLRN